MPGNLTYQAYRLIWSSLDWLFPPECGGGCGKKGVRWCTDCYNESHIIGNRCCEMCGDITIEFGVCQHCQGVRPSYTQARSWAIFKGPVRNLVHRLKYKNDMCLGDALAQPMIHDIQRNGWNIDLLIPVPLSLARLAERGYNQAALIAFPIAVGLRVPYHPKALRKVKDTRSQVGLTYEARKVNLIDAFEANVAQVDGKRVLVIDDVTTSGSTLNECACVLKAAGAREVYGYTFARAAHNKLAANAEEPPALEN